MAIKPHVFLIMVLSFYYDIQCAYGMKSTMQTTCANFNNLQNSLWAHVVSVTYGEGGKHHQNQLTC